MRKGASRPAPMHSCNAGSRPSSVRLHAGGPERHSWQLTSLTGSLVLFACYLFACCLPAFTRSWCGRVATTGAIHRCWRLAKGAGWQPLAQIPNLAQARTRQGIAIAEGRGQDGNWQKGLLKGRAHLGSWWHSLNLHYILHYAHLHLAIIILRAPRVMVKNFKSQLEGGAQLCGLD